MLKGQWTGPYAGTGSGNAIVELDEVNGAIQGSITVYPSDPSLPPVFAFVDVPLDAAQFEKNLLIFPIDWSTGEPVEWRTISNRYAEMKMPAYAATKWARSNETLYISWVTNLETHGLAVLTRGFPNEPSSRTPTSINNWSEFKAFASTLESNRFIFRGQSDNNWRLRTSFHRTGRADLRRFINNDVHVLHRHLSGLTAHFFNLTNPVENGAFYTLVQHHGYPTPLLDWTYSPYVGAYFAFRNLPKHLRTDQHKVRVIMFDAREWQRDFRQLQKFTPAQKHFSLFLPLGINNARLVPQQALMTISNIDDIETYVEEREAEKSKTYLSVIDLPGSERQRVMEELSMMGITAGSLFPGLDGACEQLREQFFDL